MSKEQTTGGPVLDVDKLNAQLVTIEKIQDDAYDKAIDHAVKVLQEQSIGIDSLVAIAFLISKVLELKTAK